MNKTIIYIIGAGRSGTTLLDIVLGNNKNSISLGEINRFFKRDGIPPKRNRKSKTFVFWKKIRKSFDSLSHTNSYHNLDALFHKNEYHSFVIKSFLNRNDIVYKEELNNLYKVIFQNVDEEIIIESSKYPLRALNLSNCLENEKFSVKYIYLKKNPVRVVDSFQKKNLEQPSKNFLASNLYYLAVNILCNLVVQVLKRKGHKVFCLKLEDFIKSPDNLLELATNTLGEDFSYCRTIISENQPLNTGFLFDGNRIRLKETLFLQPYNNKSKKNIKYYFTRMFNYIVYR